MTQTPWFERTPAERVLDLAEMERALRLAVREALLRHKREGHSLVIWQDGKVVVLSSDQIPLPQGDSDRAPDDTVTAI